MAVITRRRLFTGSGLLATLYVALRGESMARGDDLAGLIPPPRLADLGPAAPVGYRTGTIIAFNTTTGENQVDVDGVIVKDLPMLNTTEVLQMVPGARVAILTVPSSNRGSSTWMILGRSVIPGTPDAASALRAISIRSDTTTTLESTASATYVDLATVGPVVSDVPIGATGRAVVFVSSYISVPSGGTVEAGDMSFEVSGATSLPPSSFGRSVRIGASGGIGCTGSFTRAVPLDALTPGLHTFTGKYLSLNGVSVTFGYRSLTIISL